MITVSGTVDGVQQEHKISDATFNIEKLEGALLWAPRVTIDGATLTLGYHQKFEVALDVTKTFLSDLIKKVVVCES
jgi:hypothetical protein